MLEAKLFGLHPGDQCFVGAHAIVAVVIPGRNEREATVRIPEQWDELTEIVEKIGGQYEIAKDQNELLGSTVELPFDPAANLVEPSRRAQVDLVRFKAKQTGQTLQFIGRLLKVENQNVAGQNAGLSKDGLQSKSEHVVLVGQYGIGEDEYRATLKCTARSGRSRRWRTDVKRFVDYIIFWKEKPVILRLQKILIHSISPLTITERFPFVFELSTVFHAVFVAKKTLIDPREVAFDWIHRLAERKWLVSLEIPSDSHKCTTKN